MGLREAARRCGRTALKSEEPHGVSLGLGLGELGKTSPKSNTPQSGPEIRPTNLPLPPTKRELVPTEREFVPTKRELVPTEPRIRPNRARIRPNRAANSSQPSDSSNRAANSSQPSANSSQPSANSSQPSANSSQPRRPNRAVTVRERKLKKLASSSWFFHHRYRLESGILEMTAPLRSRLGKAAAPASLGRGGCR